MPAGLDQVAPGEWHDVAEKLMGGGNEYLGRARRDQLARMLEEGRGTPAENYAAGLELARELLEAGEEDAALAHLESALALKQRTPELAQGPLPHRLIALAYMRQAEVQNCVQLHNKECCLFPLAGGGKHTRSEPARNALLHYQGALKADRGNLELRWLMNLASMMLEDHPNSMPVDLRFPAHAFDSDYDLGRFEDVAGELGVDSYDLCGGVVVEDFDGDGQMDVVVTSADPTRSAQLFRGLPGMAFEDATQGSGLDTQYGGLNCVGADYDGDGDTDLLILRGAWLFKDGRIRNSLMRNDAGVFVDVTREAGLGGPGYPTQAACFGDFDDDGDLDLYVVNESCRETGPHPGDYPAQFYVNDGTGHFSESAEAAGLTNDRYAKGVAAGDFDNDGDLDIYVSNIGVNRLYRNDGGGHFSDVAPRLGVGEPSKRSFACWFFDYDNDGWLDLFVTAFEASVADVAEDHLGYARGGERPMLYRNLGGRFEELGQKLGLDHPWLPMGANFGDLDNDGFLDIYLATGDPNFETLVPNVALRNDAGHGFQDVSTSAGLGHLQKGHGVAFCDFDGDGDQDIYNQLGGFYPGDRFRNALFQNPGQGNHYLKLRLVGKGLNPSALGARVMLEVETPDGLRQIHRAPGAVSSFGSMPLRQEIGLGRATGIRSVEVRWPGMGGALQRFGALPLDSSVEIREGELLPRILAARAVR